MITNAYSHTQAYRFALHKRMQRRSRTHIIRIARPYHMMIICVCLLIQSVSFAMVFIHSKYQRILCPSSWAMDHETFSILLMKKRIGAARKKNHNRLFMDKTRSRNFSFAYIWSIVFYACMHVWFSRHPRPSFQYWLWLCCPVLLIQHIWKRKEIDIEIERSETFWWISMIVHVQSSKISLWFWCDMQTYIVCRIEMQSHKIYISLHLINSRLGWVESCARRNEDIYGWMCVFVDRCRWSKINASRWSVAVGHDECWIWENIAIDWIVSD